MKSIFIGQTKTHIKRGFTRYKVDPDDIDFVELCDKIAEEISAIHKLPKDYIKNKMLKVNPLTYDLMDAELKQY